MTVNVDESLVRLCLINKKGMKAFSIRKLKTFGDVVYFTYFIDETGSLKNVKKMILHSVYDKTSWKPFPHQIPSSRRKIEVGTMAGSMSSGANESFVLYMAKVHGDYRIWEVEFPSV
jgi:hypothetical protein